MGTKSAEILTGWLTYELAMAYSSLGRTKLTELVTSGAVPAARVGRRVLISRSGLDEYLRCNSYSGVTQR